jgi:hypothetical protein
VPFFYPCDFFYRNLNNVVDRLSSDADPDPDPTFHFDADPDQDPKLYICWKIRIFYLYSELCQLASFCLFHQRNKWHNFHYLDSKLKFYGKSTGYSVSLYLDKMDTPK